jgi:[protein-PII] uridylyltransferase
VQQATNGERVLSDPERQERLHRTLEQVLRRQVSVAERVARRQRPSLVKPRQVPLYPPVVEVDNAVSDRYTVIDVFAPDRVGLLYDITTALSELGLNIHLAKISTKADQAADVFYVFRAGDGKVKEPEAVERLKEKIYAALKQKP